MTDSENTNKAVNRNEFLITQLLKFLDSLPKVLPQIRDLQKDLKNLHSALQGMRPPRVMVIGRCKSGKSSLINAICGLKVAEVSDIKPETGMAEWKEYYHNGSDLIRILDTRGLQESEAPRQSDSAKNPYESIIEAVKKECPDIILFLCKATEVYSASNEDLNKCELIIIEINKMYQSDLPIIGVLTKCDELSPPREPLPTDNERKKRNVQEQVTNFSVFLNQRQGLNPDFSQAKKIIHKE